MPNRRLSFGSVTDGSVTSRLHRRSSSFRGPSTRKPAREAERPSKGRRVQKNIPLIPLPTLSDQQGIVLTCGTGDIGQLGLGVHVMECLHPRVVRLSFRVVDIAAGGMHSVCLSNEGDVYTFGCNDEGALGRDTTGNEDLQYRAGKVELPEKIVRISAGDSHTAALSERGHLFIWGNFRDSKGSMGLDANGRAQQEPKRVLIEVVVVQIASGCDHLMCLANNGIIYTFGNGEQGQLGRVSKYFIERGGRRGIGHMLEPAPVPLLKVRGQGKITFENIWSGSYSCVARSKGTKELYGFGLNNTHQLGIVDKGEITILQPLLLRSFELSRWKEVALGQHHTLAIGNSGKLYSLGEGEYGRLGLGEECRSKSKPTLVRVREKFSQVACGDNVSFAIDMEGNLHAWGMGTNGQLGHGSDDDTHCPLKVASLQRKKILKVSGGGQHTVILIAV